MGMGDLGELGELEEGRGGGGQIPWGEGMDPGQVHVPGVIPGRVEVAARRLLEGAWLGDVYRVSVCRVENGWILEEWYSERSFWWVCRDVEEVMEVLLGRLRLEEESRGEESS